MQKLQMWFVQALKYTKSHKWLIGSFAMLLLMLPLTVVLSAQKQNKDTHAAPIPLAVDVQSAKNQTSASTKITSGAFTTTSGNELVVVFLSSDGSTSSPQSFKSVTGGGLTFALAGRANTQRGTSEVWYAYSSGILTNTVITATRASGSYKGIMRVMTFKGARNVLGTVRGVSAATGVPSVSLTTTVDGSLIFGVGNDPTRAITHTAGVGQTITQQSLASTNKQTFWTQKYNVAVPTTGTTVVLDNATPTSDAWNMVAVEVLPLPPDNTGTTGNTSGLVAAYSFNEGAGSTAVDASGNGNTGTVANGGWGAGKYGSGLYFNGLSSTLTVNSSASLDISGSTMTLSMWLNPQATPGDAVVLGKFWNPTMTSPFYQYGLELQNGGTTPVFQIGTATGVQAVSMGSPLPLNQWSHLAIVFDGTSALFYLNGSLIHTEPLAATITPRGNPLQLGADANGAQFYKGLLDEVRIYKTALSGAEVVADMNSAVANPTGGSITPTSGVNQPTAIPTPTTGVTVTPTTVPPTGSASTGCESNPSRCGYPDATNTGVPAGTSLTVLNGDQTFTTPNAVIEGKDIRGCVDVQAPGVTIRKSKVTCNSIVAIGTSNAAIANGAARLTIQDVEVACVGANITGISAINMNVTRAYVHGCENGFSLERDVAVSESFVPGVVELNGGHGDAMQFASPVSGISITHNTLFSHNATASINWDETDQTVNLVAQNNLLAGGAYTVYCPKVAIPAGGYKIMNNRFGTYSFGHSTNCTNSGIVFTGNYEDSNMSPIAAQ